MRRERVLKIHGDTAKRIHTQAKMRRAPIVPAFTVTPPEGTLGFIRRQGNALAQMLGRRGCKPHVIMVAMIMANCSNELGETDVGQRRICEIAGAIFDAETGAIVKRGAISPRGVVDAWAQLTRIEHFEKTVTIPDTYDPQRKRRAGTFHKLAVPTDEQLSLMYQPLARVRDDRQQALPLVAPDEPAPIEPPAAARAPSPAHVGGDECPCRPCAAAREALNFLSSDPVASSAREASQTEDLSETEDTTRLAAVTSPRAMLPTVAPSGASNAALEPIDQPPTRGGTLADAFGQCAPSFCVGRLADNELANARRIQRDNARRMAHHNAPRRKPAQLSWIQETAPTATERSISTGPDGQRVFDPEAFLVNVGYRPDSIRTQGKEQNPDQTRPLARALRKSEASYGHPEACGCLKCEVAEGQSDE